MENPIFYITNETPSLGNWTEISIGGVKLMLNDEQADEMEFSRETLTGGMMKFTRNAYDYIDGSDFEATFTMVLMLDGLSPSTDDAEWVGEFHKTDCKFFPSSERIEVLPLTLDPYKTIMDSFTKEFDLIQYQPPLTPLVLTRRAILQIYVRGASFLTNYVDSAFWEIEAINPTSVSATLTATYRFGYSDRKYFVTGGGTGLTPDVSGTYIYDSMTGNSTREDGVYFLFFQNFPTNRAVIARVSDNVHEYEGAIDDPIPNVPVESDQGVLMTSLSDPGSVCRAFYVDFYTRILTNATSVGGDATFAIPSTDIVDDHGVFTRIHQKVYADFLITEGNTDDGTRWGKFPIEAQHFAGKHFSRPTGFVYYPVLQSNWVDASFWIKYDSDLQDDMTEASEDYRIEHAYKLADVIKILLSAMGSTVTHEESPEYSDFLYGDDNSIRGIKRTPIIVPITNVLVSDYDEPQQVAKITMQDVDDLLRMGLRARWRIDSENRLIIEHKHFFDNGGSYVDEVIGVDLTNELETFTKRAWGTDQDSFEYEKSAMPERYEFGWQGKSSKPFIGYPLDINSPWVEKGNIEKWNIGRFCADIDLIHVGSSEVSKESFLFVEALEGELFHYVPIVNVVVDTEEEYNLQNGYASFLWLVPNLHLYSLPAPNITVNRYPTTALSIARRKLQDVSLSTSSVVTTLALVTTDLGSGKAFKIEREIFSNKKKISLRHNTQ